jgi:hypothetical protein
MTAHVSGRQERSGRRALVGRLERADDEIGDQSACSLAAAGSSGSVLMLGAGATHLRRGELQMLPVNALLAALAPFIAIERFGWARRHDTWAARP